MDDISHVRNSPEHLLRMLGADDDEEFFLYRPHGPITRCSIVRLAELERDIKRNGRAFIFRFDGEDLSGIAFVDSGQSVHECIALDFDCTVEGGIFLFGFMGKRGLYSMQPKDMREHGFRFKPVSDARIAIHP